MRTTIAGLLGLLLAWIPVSAQDFAQDANAWISAEADVRVEAFFTGRVLDEQGAPLAGAVVLSSAGGQTVTDAAGAFTLAVERPIAAESLWVTALVASSNGETSSAAVLVAAPPPGGTLSLGELVPAANASCAPNWLPTFGCTPEVNGASFWFSSVQTLAVFDDGGGPALYAAGQFSQAGGKRANRIAKWDGTRWSPLGSGLGSSTHALVAFDDGSGPALYAGGDFFSGSAVGGPARRVAKWDGTQWFALGSGIQNGVVRSLAVYDDGSGEALYAGGSFTQAGGVPVHRVAKWDGTQWTALGSGIPNGEVRALAVYDGGAGPELCAAGTFTQVDGQAIPLLAKWNGAEWSSLGRGVSSAVLTPWVSALAVYDDGDGPALYAAGEFTRAGTVQALRIAKWDGSDWSALGVGLNNPVYALAVYDDGGGPALYASGEFSLAGGAPAKRVAKWDGAAWSALDVGVVYGWIYAMVEFDDGSEKRLVVGGTFHSMGGMPARFLAQWDGSAWSQFRAGLNGQVRALAAYDDGNGEVLYAGGMFTMAGGGDATSGLARWDGTGWSPAGKGLKGTVRALLPFDDGSGPALYVGGNFSAPWDPVTDIPAVARWDGNDWSPLGPGLRSANALAVYDDGSGEALYAGGRVIAGNTSVPQIAKWGGSSWVPLASGPINEEVNALIVHDDGSGAALYAGGRFTSVHGVPANRIAKWDGANWSAMGSGMAGGAFSAVAALAVYDDGSGAALYAGGTFTSADGVPANRIAKWDGVEWSGLGSGIHDLGGVSALHVFDAGDGTALYAGGSFSVAGGVAANRVAKWDGATWSPLGGGILSLGIGNSFVGVYALQGFDDGSGPSFVVGGSFATSSAGDSFLARWSACPIEPGPWTDLGGGSPGSGGLIPRLSGSGLFAPASLNWLGLSEALPGSAAHLVLGLSAIHAPFKGGTLVPAPDLLLLGLPMSDAGTLGFSFHLPWDVPAGSSFWIQAWVTDGGGSEGFAASNALHAEAQ